MTKCIKKEINKEEYKLKVNNNQVKILPANPDAYRKISKLLKTLNASYHTYQLKQERSFRVVLRNIHHSANLDELKFELQNHGHEVINVSSIRHRITKSPLSLFFIDLKQKPNNKEAYNINRLMNSSGGKISWPRFKQLFITRFGGEETTTSSLITVAREKPLKDEDLVAYAARLYSILWTRWQNLTMTK